MLPGQYLDKFRVSFIFPCSSFFFSSLFNFGKHKRQPTSHSSLKPPDRYKYQNPEETPAHEHMTAQSTVNSEAVLGKFFQRVKYSAKLKNVAKQIESFTPSQEVPTQFLPGLSNGIQTKFSILRPMNPPSVRPSWPAQQPMIKNPVQTFSHNFITQTRSEVRSEPKIIKNVKTNEVRFMVDRPLATNTHSLNNLNQYQA